MTQEIIYTSAVRGLKLGSKGFCTVASTRNMSKPLAERLESLSGYRHLYPPGDARNPITYSHVVLTIAGKRYYVLSRVADAGYDYSKRSNKIAHHIALTQQETVSAGPVWLLSQHDFMETTWSGEPRFFEIERVVSRERVEPRICETWQRLAGDSGWGGVLAETVWSKRQNEVYVIYRDGMDILGLMLESQALLPEQSRWMATFTTNYTKLPPHIECRWRCVLESSEEVAKIRRMRHVTVLDLSQPLGPPPAGAAVDAARNGQVIGGQRAESPPAIGESGVDLNTATYAETKGSPATPAVPPPRDAEIGLARPDTPPPRTLVSMSPRRLEATRRKRSRFYRITATFLLAASLLAVVAGTAYYFGVRSGTPEQIVAGDEESKDTDLGDKRRTQSAESTAETESTEDDDEGSEDDPTPPPESAGSRPGPAIDGEEDSASNEGEEQDDERKKETSSTTEEETPPATPTPERLEDNNSSRSGESEAVIQRMEMPKSVSIISTSFDDTDTHIGWLGSCRNPSLRLLHADLELRSSPPPLTWSVHRKGEDSDPVGTFWIKNDEKHELLFSGHRSERPFISRGALYVECEGCKPQLVLLRKADPARLVLRLSEIGGDDAASVTKSVFASTFLRISDVVLQGESFSSVNKPQLEMPQTEVTMELLSGKTYPLKIQVSCSPMPNGRAGKISAIFRGKTSEFTVRDRMEFYEHYRKRLLKCDNDLLRKKWEIEQTQRNLKDKPRELEKAIRKLEDERDDIRTCREELSKFWTYCEEFKNNNTIVITLCHHYDDDIAIPVTEDELSDNDY